MGYALVIKEEAVLEITDAFAWYEDQKEGLGSNFVTTLDEYFDRILSRPSLYPSLNKKQHVAVMRKYPYKIVYSIEKKVVIVYAVFHTKRNPLSLNR